MHPLQPAGPFQQLANLCFFLSALVSDVLLIRLFLCGSYIWLFTAALLGMPKWPSGSPTGNIAIDTLVWATLCLTFHGNAFVRFVLDERHIRFKTEDDEQLWRFFHRRGGMGRLEMKQAMKRGAWLCVPAGKPIVQGPEAHLRFFVLVEGTAHITHKFKDMISEPRPLVSGNCFDMGLLSVFGVFNGMVKTEEHTFSAVAETNCLLYSWTIDELTYLATQTAPCVGAFFRNFTLAQLGMFLAFRLYPGHHLVCATGDVEPPGVLSGKCRSRDFTDPLRPYEVHRVTLTGFAAWLKRSFSPFPPPGLRHNALPTTGIMARNRLVAEKAAKAKAALEILEEAGGVCEELASQASAGGSDFTLEVLQRVQTLAALSSLTVECLLERAATYAGGDLHPAASAKSAGLAPAASVPRHTPRDLAAASHAIDELLSAHSQPRSRRRR